VCVPAIDVGEHRAQAGGEVDPAASAEHACVGEQGIAKEARGAGGIEAFAISSIRFPLNLGEVVLLVAAAVRGGEQGPADDRDLEGGLKRDQAGVGMPVGIRRIRLRGDSASPTSRRELCSQTKR